MSIFKPLNVNPSKVRYMDYISTEDKPDEPETKPATPVQPAMPELK